MLNNTSLKDDESLKLAIAISLLRSKAQQNRKEPNALAPSQSDALRWKRKVRYSSIFFFSMCSSGNQIDFDGAMVLKF